MDWVFNVALRNFKVAMSVYGKDYVLNAVREKELSDEDIYLLEQCHSQLASQGGNKMVNLDDYKRKIEYILINNLTSFGDNDSLIQFVHTWLHCEWLFSDMTNSDRELLDNHIDECAKEIIGTF